WPSLDPVVGASGGPVDVSAPSERLTKGGLERREATLRVREVNADDRQVVALDGSEIALGLGVDQAAERVRPAGDRPVRRMVRRELEEPPSRRPALVELTGRVQEARPEPGRRRTVGAVAKQRANPLEAGVRC